MIELQYVEFREYDFATAICWAGFCTEAMKISLVGALMFQVNYNTLDKEKKRITEVRDISEFENGVNTIVGQFQLVFNERKSGVD